MAKHGWAVGVATISTLSIGAFCAPQVFADGLSAPHFPNQAQSDSMYWSRASNDFYIQASSVPYTESGTQTLLNIQPGESLYLMAYTGDKNLTSVRWLVNSPDAAIVPDSPDELWTYGSKTVQMAVFTASEPGIYTVQASSEGQYSVPLVLIVGLQQLTGRISPESSQWTGVQPFSATDAGSALATGETGDIQYVEYNPIANTDWIPVQGTVMGNESHVVVQLSSNSGQGIWNYLLPVQNHEFSADIRSPFTGSINISYISQFYRQLNTSGDYTWQGGYTLSVNGPPTSESRKALLYSAFMDGNVNPDASKIASQIFANSPSPETAAAAIANYASESMSYDWSMVDGGKYLFEDVASAYSLRSGVCEEIAELAATMMKSVGIPAETVIGKAPVNSAEDNHEWLQADVGGRWVVMDPTWDSPNQGPNTLLSNEYMTETVSLETSHLPDNRLVGSIQ
ncbi:transglutaminase domain-containing protein [Alicyclobacillus sp. TC]|uniref:transglutaminase domain-containing protein n=1 Tax=Alicyclobacillus sp. TC TaxID=2606450 RepID=UPI00193317F0|nr:transglutaminase-like domain-containing protein [Alicyclobacillus sp. TC]QRF24358.1 transglutaminase domain-containing protein [Alicyclobacillus sp. TC]